MAIVFNQSKNLVVIGGKELRPLEHAEVDVPVSKLKKNVFVRAGWVDVQSSGGSKPGPKAQTDQASEADGE